MSDPLKALFTQMDATEESTALAAMRDAGALLRGKGLGFGRVVERLEHSLLSPKIVSTLKMLDGSTHEAANAFRAAKKMLNGSGLTFTAIARALEHASHPSEIDRLGRALADAQAMAEHYAAEAKRLRSEVSQLRPGAALHAGSVPWRQWTTIGVLSLICLWIWSPSFSGHRETAVTASVGRPLWRVDSAQWGATNPNPPARCWRDRSISGQCF